MGWHNFLALFLNLECVCVCIALWFYTPISAAPCWELLLSVFGKSLTEILSMVWLLRMRLGSMWTKGTFWNISIKCSELFICQHFSQKLHNKIFWIIVLFLWSLSLFCLSLFLVTFSWSVNSCAYHIISCVREERGVRKMLNCH